jgi:hypothetical protein
MSGLSPKGSYTALETVSELPTSAMQTARSPIPCDWRESSVRLRNQIRQKWISWSGSLRMRTSVLSLAWQSSCGKLEMSKIGVEESSITGARSDPLSNQEEQLMGLRLILLSSWHSDCYHSSAMSHSCSPDYCQ